MTGYNQAIPNPTDDLSDSQGQLKSNFGALDTYFGKNHYAFSTAPGVSGKHKFVQMPINALPGILAGEGAIYTKTANAATQLFYTPDASGNEYQLTSTSAAKIASFGGTTNGWTFLPGTGGLVLNYGTVSLPGPVKTGAVLFSRAFSSAPYSLVLSVQDSVSNETKVWISSGTAPSATGFTWETSNKSVNAIYWTAIGRA